MDHEHNKQTFGIFSLEFSEIPVHQLNLVKLNACSNSKITNVNHMSNLKKLYAEHGCGINDDGIKYLNLSILHAETNPKITIKI